MEWSSWPEPRLDQVPTSHRTLQWSVVGADASAVAPGDVLVSDGSGQVTWLQPDGSVVDVLQTGVSGHATGMATGPDSSIYVTHFSANRVTSLAPDRTQQGDFGSGYDSAPESLAFDSAGNQFVGLAAGTATDWIALADDCTLVYTSEGHRTLRCWPPRRKPR